MKFLFLKKTWKGLIVLLAALTTLIGIFASAYQHQAFAQPSANCVYVVQPGDQLRYIAPQFHTTAQDLARVNHLASADRIFIGQRLTVCHGYAAAAQGFPQAAPKPAGGDAMSSAELAYVRQVFGQRGWADEAVKIIGCESHFHKMAWNATPVYWNHVLLGHAGGIFQIVDATYQSTRASRQGRSRYDAYAATDAAYEIVSRDASNGWRWREWACSSMVF